MDAQNSLQGHFFYSGDTFETRQIDKDSVPTAMVEGQMHVFADIYQILFRLAHGSIYIVRTCCYYVIPYLNNDKIQQKPILSKWLGYTHYCMWAVMENEYLIY